MRICTEDPERWGVDRKAAIIAQQDASALGFAPAILASTLPEGHYLANFVKGTQVTTEFVRQAKLIPMIAATLRELNAHTTVSRWFSPFDDLRNFLELGDAEGASRPARLEEMLALVMRVEALFRTRAPKTGFCHSDLVPQNFLLTDSGLKLVDFDYAGMGWTAFELASFACQAELNEQETELLLKSYTSSLDDSQRARVELMRFVAGVREAVWATMAEPILSDQTIPLDGWTYQGYAASNLSQASQVVDSGAFNQYLKEARHVAADAAI